MFTVPGDITRCVLGSRLPNIRVLRPRKPPEKLLAFRMGIRQVGPEEDVHSTRRYHQVRPTLSPTRYSCSPTSKTPGLPNFNLYRTKKSDKLRPFQARTNEARCASFLEIVSARFIIILCMRIYRAERESRPRTSHSTWRHFFDTLNFYILVITVSMKNYYNARRSRGAQVQVRKMPQLITNRAREPRLGSKKNTEAQGTHIYTSVTLRAIIQKNPSLAFLIRSHRFLVFSQWTHGVCKLVHDALHRVNRCLPMYVRNLRRIRTGSSCAEFDCATAPRWTRPLTQLKAVAWTRLRKKSSFPHDDASVRARFAETRASNASSSSSSNSNSSNSSMCEARLCDDDVAATAANRDTAHNLTTALSKLQLLYKINQLYMFNDLILSSFNDFRAYFKQITCIVESDKNKHRIVVRRHSQRRTDAHHADPDAHDTAIHRADVFGVDGRHVGDQSRSRGRFRTAAGRALATNRGTDPKPLHRDAKQRSRTAAASAAATTTTSHPAATTNNRAAAANESTSVCSTAGGSNTTAAATAETKHGWQTTDQVCGYHARRRGAPTAPTRTK
ncbi:unnamed protein product [Trichogramma brassicae]|uniref:Uncharacterized protein n=1 Tax=Trichogramma brassicae TaxID=86971 RepID=A0A6H5J3D7_9HYME|nr:unnamed protein product [Trichogramma brassicae]